jgi:uncharacterized membrane protein
MAIFYSAKYGCVSAIQPIIFLHQLLANVLMAKCKCHNVAAIVLLLFFNVAIHVANVMAIVSFAVVSVKQLQYCQ